MPPVLGVDVSLGRGLDLALVSEGLLKETWTRVGHGRLGELLRELRPVAVAIDAPPTAGLGLLRSDAERDRLPVPPPPGKHLDRRVAEYELSRRGIGSHQTHHEESRLFSWMTAGFDAYRSARAAGFPPYLGRGRKERVAFETFPYASYVALAGCLSPGRRWKIAWRRAVLQGAGLTGLGEEASIDQLDAACAALTGERFLLGQGSMLGDPREGVIILPTPSLKERYRRCTPPDRGVKEAVSPSTPRLCECGCGSAVRRRFLPGHAARLRARLVAEVRTGSRAAGELKRLGWDMDQRDARG